MSNGNLLVECWLLTEYKSCSDVFVVHSLGTVLSGTYRHLTSKKWIGIRVHAHILKLHKWFYNRVSVHYHKWLFYCCMTMKLSFILNLQHVFIDRMVVKKRKTSKQAAAYYKKTYYCDVIIGVMASQSSASRLFTQAFIRAQLKENVNASRHRPLCGKFTGGRWIPCTKGHWHGNSFHLITSSCFDGITRGLCHALWM